MLCYITNNVLRYVMLCYITCYVMFYNICRVMLYT